MPTCISITDFWQHYLSAIARAISDNMVGFTEPKVNMQEKTHIAFVMRLFSSQGGLELYALKLIEGLLEKGGYSISVICERDESGLSHPSLQVFNFAGPPPGSSKWQKIEHYYKAASDCVSRHGPFDIVHSQHFPIDKLDVVTFHNHTASRLSQPHIGYPFERWLNNCKLNWVKAYQLRFKYDRELCRKAAMRIFVAQVMQRDFYETYNLSAQDNPFAIAPPGASMQMPMNTADSAAPQKADTRESFTFLFVGKGFSKKGLDTLFNAMAILKDRATGRKIKLVIAGLSAKPLFKLRLALLAISDSVEFLGYQKDMAKVYARAQAQVLPSKMEPFGMAPVQGMQYGLVPIVSRVCGVAEVLEDGVDALILQDHLNSAELAGLMEKLANDSELYLKLSAHASIKAREVSWQKTVQATEAAYKTILGTRAVRN
jgi:glycosyltransferase involved in cell wall biosynthesis